MAVYYLDTNTTGIILYKLKSNEFLKMKMMGENIHVNHEGTCNDIIIKSLIEKVVEEVTLKDNNLIDYSTRWSQILNKAYKLREEGETVIFSYGDYYTQNMGALGYYIRKIKGGE